MTIQQAIDWLERIKKKHGPDIHLVFDCPECERSFEPGTITVEAIHVKGKQV